jgi:hypothetical protein
MDGKNGEDQAAKYISLALMTEGPPDFKLILPANRLPPDAFSVREFLDLVKEFYATAKVETVWSSHRARIDQVVLESEPQGVFDLAAQDAVRKWVYEPRKEDGVAVESSAKARLVFDPAN